MVTIARNGASVLPSDGAVAGRFSDIPSAVDIPVREQDDVVEINLDELLDDPTELCVLLENEEAARIYWMTVAMAYAKQNKVDHAIELLQRAGKVLTSSSAREKVSMTSCLCFLYLFKARTAPRKSSDESVKTKEHWLQQATQSLNEAMRINPSFSALRLARGVLQLMKASLQSPVKGTGPNERDSLLQNALKTFDDALRESGGKNIMALMGKARALYSMGQYPKALAAYQEVLTKKPSLTDPDPRIGIGCCFWQLGYKNDARITWERSLEVNPNKWANSLLGIYYLDSTSKLKPTDPAFATAYKKAMTSYIAPGYNLDKKSAIACSILGSYCLSTKQYDTTNALAHRAIEYTDINATASDGWYLLARKEHYENNLSRASELYRNADEARGGGDRGFLPAKFGAAQIAVLRNDIGEAKLRLEKLIKQTRMHEAMILLGTIYAEEVFANEVADVKQDKSQEKQKAIQYLEMVRNAWKDPRRNDEVDPSVLLLLARLYEAENPENSLQCMNQVVEHELQQIPNEDKPVADYSFGPDVEPTELDAKRKAEDARVEQEIKSLLPPQLLNNLGCFLQQAKKHSRACDMFLAAKSSCMKVAVKHPEIDTESLMTTINYNLARSYEYQGMIDEAISTYETILKNYPGYTDAQTRLAYIKLRKFPQKEGPDAVKKLYQENNTDLEVRALYGWYLGRIAGRKPTNLNEDAEYRHYKHTLQHHDKHDRYALIGMGNMHLAQARDMRRESDSDKQKRSVMYSKALEFFDKALALDPKNAFAATGVAITLIEDKKDFKAALPILIKVRETLKDQPHPYVNLGHLYAELRQFSKSIENYETALSMEGKENDHVILSCLGRVLIQRGRTERDLESFEKALAIARKAHSASPDLLHLRFNVAFVQVQLVSTIVNLSEKARSCVQLQSAIDGLGEAIQTLEELAASPHPPYPKGDLEQRAIMARNTLRKQLDRAMTVQKDYEAANAEKLRIANDKRLEEMRKKEEATAAERAKEEARKERIRQERAAQAERDRAMAAEFAEQERRIQEAEMTSDGEGGRVKRKRAPRAPRTGGTKRSSKKKSHADSESDNDHSGSDEGEAAPKKKRRLASKGLKSKEPKSKAAKPSRDSGKFKSAEIIESSSDSDSDSNISFREDDSGDELEKAERRLERENAKASQDSDAEGGKADSLTLEKMDVDEDEDVARPVAKRKRGHIIDDDDEDEDEEGSGNGGADTSMADD